MTPQARITRSAWRISPWTDARCIPPGGFSRRRMPSPTTPRSIPTAFQDIYAVFADEPAGGGAELRLNFHPMAPEIWFGGLIMALGGFLSLSDRRLRVGAPPRKKPEGAVA